MAQNEDTDDFLTRVFKELNDQQNNARHCVILMHGFIELLINVLIEAHCKNGKQITSSSRDYPHSTKLLILYELSILNAAQFKVLSWFRKLRNRAAHTPLFDLTPNDLVAFRGTSFESVDQFALLCVDIFCDIWNQHAHLFAEKFSPPAANEDDGNVEPDHQLLSYTQSVARSQHLISHVRVRISSDYSIEFRYDHYPDCERITLGTGEVYAHRKWQAWKKSDDYGESGEQVSSELSRSLESYTSWAMAPLSSLKHRDESQGPTVWKLLKHDIQGDCEYLEYLRTRENPIQGGIYPLFRFLRYISDPTKKLLLKDFLGNIIHNNESNPVAIRYDYLFLIPGAYSIHYNDADRVSPFAKVKPWTFEDLTTFGQMDDWQI